MTHRGAGVCDHDEMPPAGPLREPQLGEWVCLGVLYEQPAHGWAIAKQLRPDGDIGRIWHLSRPLTYRALDLLTTRAWVEPRGEEPGEAGPNRTILAITRTGRSRFRAWLRTPVPHLRDLRSELLVKLVFAERYRIDVGPMLDEQRELIDRLAAHRDRTTDDVVALWRTEATEAARRFLDRVQGGQAGVRRSPTG